MICPKCGEPYEDDMPRCLWCGAPKPVAKQNSADSALPQVKTEPMENKEEYVSYVSPRNVGFSIFVFLSYVAAVLLAILGMFIFFAVDGKASLLGILFLFVPFSVYYDLSDSKNCVCEIKWYKDKFVICTRSDEFTFTFDKDELYKIENDAFGGKIFVFRKDKQCFYVNERIFPEVVDAMQKIYCE